MNDLVIGMLVVVVILGLANLVGMSGLRRSVQEMDRRVMLLEIQQEAAVTTKDLQGMIERQANQEGQLRTMLEIMRAIQKYLMENEQ